MKPRAVTRAAYTPEGAGAYFASGRIATVGLRAMRITGTAGITDSVSASFPRDTNPQVMAAIQLGRCLLWPRQPLPVCAESKKSRLVSVVIRVVCGDPP